MDDNQITLIIFNISGVLIVPVAVGQDLDWPNLEEITSDVSYVFNVSTYGDLKTIIANVVNISCSGKWFISIIHFFIIVVLSVLYFNDFTTSRLKIVKN